MGGRLRECPGGALLTRRSPDRRHRPVHPYRRLLALVHRARRWWSPYPEWRPAVSGTLGPPVWNEIGCAGPSGGHPHASCRKCLVVSRQFGRFHVPGLGPGTDPRRVADPRTPVPVRVFVWVVESRGLQSLDGRRRWRTRWLVAGLTRRRMKRKDSRLKRPTTRMNRTRPARACGGRAMWMTRFGGDGLLLRRMRRRRMSWTSLALRLILKRFLHR